MRVIGTLLRWTPLVLFLVLIVVFSLNSDRFLSGANLAAILVQSSWLVAVALGMNFVLLTAGVDLSVGAAMYIAALAVGLGLPNAPVWVSLLGSLLVGGIFGAVNATLIGRLRLPAFIVTLALLFVGRGVGLFFSGTRVVYASTELAKFGRNSLFGIPTPLL